MAYERCVRKKLQSLFEYLDTDNDNRITLECLLRGFNRLQSYSATGQDDLGRTSTSPPHGDEFGHHDDIQRHADMCEYEVEELIRCVPKADATGQITLQDFLAAKETVMSKLTKLRLLQ